MANIIKKDGGKEQHQVTTPRAQREQWNPWNRMRELLEWDPFREMSRGFFPGEGRSEGFVPQFEVRETNDAFVFKADLPGVKEEDVEIHLTGNRLTINGHREAEDQQQGDRYYAYEVSYGSFSRSFTLPDSVNHDDARAEMKNGVLMVHVPKRPEAQPRKIQLGSGSTANKPKA